MMKKIGIFKINSLLGYIYYTRGFIVTIPFTLTWYIIYITPIVSPPQPPPLPHLKQLQEVS
jgi:hypothetical protein